MAFFICATLQLNMNSIKSNRLLSATSPYLLQHAYNPVDWFEWSQEALAKAKEEDKPILLSIGYSSCHWCHVMAHQSFENEDIAQLMNEHFVCIKLDREERPDIDQIYMEAVQAMNQNGGWPLNIFLTPDQKPFFGGTYFPPNTWSQLLIQISKAFKDKRNEIETSANDLSQHLNISDLQRFKNQSADSPINQQMLDNMFQIIETRFDFTFGGLDKSPKFVMPSIWLFLARYYHLTKSEKALQMLNLTLQKAAAGGIYDQIGGGFSRYSVDAEWFAPHFEKMLYDNGQLLSLYSEAYRITKDSVYKKVVEETAEWLEREMTSIDGGFYSALDADSEGEEGKFYTWTNEELKELPENEREFANSYFGTTDIGNWEHRKNILIRESEKELPATAGDVKEKMLSIRNKRVRPGLDDKILTGWNAMMITGLTDAYRAFGNQKFITLAKNAVNFIESNLIAENKIYRSFKNNRSATTGFLDDYAFLIQAYYNLYQVTFNEPYLRAAINWCEHTIRYFYDLEEGYFYFNSNDSESLIARKKEIFDNVIPSSNAVMARNLFHLGVLMDKQEWKNMSTKMIERISHLIQSEPAYMCHWAVLAAELTKGMAEVVIVGKKAETFQQTINSRYLPFTLIMGTELKSELPLFEGREATNNQTSIYVCFNKICQLPVDNIEAALKQIENNKQ